MNPIAMHQMTSICAYDNKIVLQLHNMLEVECHLRVEVLGDLVQVTWMYCQLISSLTSLFKSCWEGRR
jgi:hypothetical protein